MDAVLLLSSATIAAAIIIQIEDQTKTECIRQGIAINSLTRRNQVREVNSEHAVLNTETNSKIFTVTFCFVFVEITSTDKELIVVRILCTERKGELTHFFAKPAWGITERFEPAFHYTIAAVLCDSC